MVALVIELIGFTGSLASLFGLIYLLHAPGTPVSPAQGGLITLALVLALVVVVARIVVYLKTRDICLQGPEEIKEYLYNWISRGQRVAIFSRDLSWVDDARMTQLLRAKAEKQELELCLPRQIPLSDDLKQRGASVYTYPTLDYVPGSRFTIINPNRQDAQIAIGRTIGDRHWVKELSAGEDALFGVANDLLEIVRRLSRADCQTKGTLP